MLTRIFSYHLVMSNYIDFISVFGQQSKARDIRFSSFREQTNLYSAISGSKIPGLHRSGRQFQICYNLKSVANTKPTQPLKEQNWSIRHVAVNHHFDLDLGTTLWIIAHGGLDFKDKIEDLTGPRGKPEDRAFGTVQECLRSSFAIHLLHCHSSTEGWRWHIKWLEAVVDEEVCFAASN